MDFNYILSRDDLPAIKAHFETHFVKPRARLACWEWQRVGIGPRKPDVPRRMLGGEPAAASVAWVLYCGPIPKGKRVLRQCDNSVCVNPKHLFLGADVQQPRRVPLRTTRTRAVRKLTADQVRFIRNSPRAVRDVARELGISFSNVSQIRRRLSWAWLD